MLSLWIYLTIFLSNPVQSGEFQGAWQNESDGTTATWIITDKHFSISYYKSSPAEFLYTEGGSWSYGSGQMTFNWEYHTRNADLVGTSKAVNVSIENDELTIFDNKWKRLDNGSPGSLAGAWLITGRKRNGEMSTMTPGVRRTMKILSGTRFQWIAYNIETKEFFGTGGGAYTTQDGRYTENIDFFSRDNNRVGASLGFDYELKEEGWHHSGLSSKGKPIYEIWSQRSKLGI